MEGQCRAAAGEVGLGRDEVCCLDGSWREGRSEPGNCVYLAIVFFFEYGNRNVITFGVFSFLFTISMTRRVYIGLCMTLMNCLND